MVFITAIIFLYTAFIKYHCSPIHKEKCSFNLKCITFLYLFIRKEYLIMYFYLSLQISYNTSDRYKKFLCLKRIYKGLRNQKQSINKKYYSFN